DVTSSATGVSADGKVVIGNSTDSNGLTHAFRWTKESGMTSLSSIPAGTHSEANGISADGKIIVGAYFAQNSWEAFRWTEETGAVSLGHITTIAPLIDKALAISADGSTIVGSGRGGAFIWTAAHQMQSISQVIANGGIDLNYEWALTSASRVSADGSIIFGGGNFFSHSSPSSSPARGWMLNLTATPSPTPTATPTATPSPTPTATPVGTPAPATSWTPPTYPRPLLKISNRLLRVHTRTAVIKATVSGNVQALFYRLWNKHHHGSHRFIHQGTLHPEIAKLRIPITLAPGENTVFLTAIGPDSKGSLPIKVTIFRE
ncbi:MAG TPA: hypothetical protein VNB29_11560, partial [Chthoniobacterales bacterium]|nr:hypothetical protein [Chthoniobacterales bacterium]